MPEHFSVTRTDLGSPHPSQPIQLGWVALLSFRPHKPNIFSEDMILATAHRHHQTLKRWSSYNHMMFFYIRENITFLAYKFTRKQKMLDVTFQPPKYKQKCVNQQHSPPSYIRNKKLQVPVLSFVFVLLGQAQSQRQHLPVSHASYLPRKSANSKWWGAYSPITGYCIHVFHIQTFFWHFHSRSLRTVGWVTNIKAQVHIVFFWPINL